MSFSSVMQNLAIGIGSGILSSIIVSVVFYVLNEFQAELDKAKDMVHPLYGIMALSLCNIDIEDLEMMNMVNNFFGDVTTKFSRFEPWRYKYELKKAMCDIDEIISDGRYYGDDAELSPTMWKEFARDIEKSIQAIEKCEKNFAKYFLKRVFKNKIIIVTLIMFASIIIIA